MTDVVYRPIVEHPVPGKPLGRHVEHDPRSREFPATLVPTVAPLRTLIHRRYGAVFNQQQGSCTGMATAGAVNTRPLHRTGEKLKTQADAVSCYSLATKLDAFEGVYPPSDTGSSGLAAAKAAKQLGWITGYRHAFGVDEALRALQVAPQITGTDWHEGMDEPTAQGFVHPTGQVRGGHEYEVHGYVAARRPYVICANSWGIGFGIRGRFKMFVDEWASLLDAQGDVTILVR